MERNLFNGDFSYDLLKLDDIDDKLELIKLDCRDNVDYTFFTKLDFLFTKGDLLLYACFNKSLLNLCIYHFFVTFSDGFKIDLGYGGYFNYEKKKNF